MTILLYKNGQWLIDGEQPLEGVSLDNLAAILTNPKDGDVVKYDETSGMWVAGDALPPVSSSDNGKVLAVEDGAWAAQNRGALYSILQIEDLQNDPSWLDANLDPITGNAVYDAVMAGKRLTASVQFYVGGAWVTAGPTDLELSSMSWDKSANDGHGVGTISVVSPMINVSSFGVNGFAFASFTCNGYGTESEDAHFSGGVWNIVPKVPNKFVVTLTPTALDYSGRMDKTVAEINAAYEAGMEIWFSVTVNGYTTLSAKLANVVDIGAANPTFTFYIIDTTNNICIVGFNHSNVGEGDTYDTVVYSLTPASRE